MVFSQVERSTWEVQGALRLVLNSIEDLNLHKTLIRRVQVLVTCLGIMAQFLVNRSEERAEASGAGGASRVRVLQSISRVTIGQDLVVSQTKERTGNLNRNQLLLIN